MKMYGLMLLAAVVGVSAHASSGQSGTSDAMVTAKAKIALFSDSRVKGREISVETKDGLVMLRGKVDSEEAKTAAAEIAKSVDGAASVKNELQVVAPRHRKAVEAKDEVLTARVQHRLRGSGYSRVAVKTNAGVVSLSGDVDDLTTSARASWKAWRVTGVKSVKNDLTVKEKK